MRVVAGCLRGSWIPLLVLALLTGPFARPACAEGGKWVALEKARDPSDPKALRVWMEHFRAEAREGAYGFVTLRFHNPLKEPQRVALRVQERQNQRGIALARSFTLGPESVTRVQLPVPGTSGWPALVIDAPRRAGIHENLHGGASWDSSVLGVFAESRVPRSDAWQAVLDGVATRAGSRSSHVRGSVKAAWCDNLSFPADWRLLSSFDLLVLNAGPDDFDAAQQDALARYVGGGGHLVLTGVTSVPTGPLGRMMTSLGTSTEQAGDRQGAYGYGRWLALRSEHPTDAGIPVGEWVEAWILHGSSGSPPHFASGIPAGFRARLLIPGLGEVPVQLFFVLILLFAILVGPVSYLWLRRKRRLAWLAVTIPLAGFVASGVILLYGFISEGFGTRGSLRSFTVLDQRTHEAATAAGRTLYAGLSPSALVPGAGTLVAPPVAGADPESRKWKWRIDLDAGGRLDGSALPSRTPTHFATMTVGRARERLRFRRRADGAFDVLHGPEFAPRAEAGSILLRTREGTYFGSDASGRLAPLGVAGRVRHVQALADLVRPMAHLPLGEGQLARQPSDGVFRIHDQVDLGNTGPHGLDAWLRSAWAQIPAGTYLARVTSLPSFDDLGLDVDYEAREHVVLGFLADEDIVE